MVANLRRLLGALGRLEAHDPHGSVRICEEMQGDVVAALEQWHHLSAIALELAKGLDTKSGVEIFCDMLDEDSKLAISRLEQAIETHGEGRLPKLRALSA